MSGASKDVTSSLLCRWLLSSSRRWSISIYLAGYSRRQRLRAHCFRELRVSKHYWRHIGQCHKPVLAETGAIPRPDRLTARTHSLHERDPLERGGQGAVLTLLIGTSAAPRRLRIGL